MTRSLGALLMTYGSPTSLDRGDVGAYLTRVRGGREPADELVDEFTRRYRIVGGSPLIEITRRQGVGLERLLGWPVEIGMRFSAPSITDGLRALAERGAERVVGIILSPQFSPLLMGGYRRALDDAQAELGQGAPRVAVAEGWYQEQAFVAAVAGRIRDALNGSKAAVLLTAHSLPRRVAEQEPGYLDQLRQTADLVAHRAGLADERWRFCWQSAGHEPGEWMSPDFADLMPILAREGYPSVLVAPVQFLADHLEILYDIDVGAREQAEQAGLAFARIASLNDDPGLLRALGAVARRMLGVPVDKSGLGGGSAESGSGRPPRTPGGPPPPKLEGHSAAQSAVATMVHGLCRSATPRSSLSKSDTLSLVPWRSTSPGTSEPSAPSTWMSTSATTRPRSSTS